jgi:hypothetical protein
MMVNINILDFYKGTSTLAMRSNGPLPQVDELHCDQSITNFSHNNAHIFYQAVVNGEIVNQSVDAIDFDGQSM